MRYTYPFTEEEAQQAYEEWGCNCGPAALAFALQIQLSAVRLAIPGFAEKRYTAPGMMRAALANMGVRFAVIHPDKMHELFAPEIALVRVQWTGPWTAPGANAKWAYRQTHWVACWGEADGRWLFDINGGVRSFPSWEKEIVPVLTASVARADGGWFPTHVWRIES